jgi:maltooligosyltrehalose trehalohydrolase
MVPDPQDPATRDRSVLDWSELGEPRHARMLRWYASLVAERRRADDLTDDDLDSVSVESGADDSWILLSRGRFRVVANLAAEPATIPLPGLQDSCDVVLAWDPEGTRHTNESVTLPGHSVALLRLAV